MPESREVPDAVKAFARLLNEAEEKCKISVQSVHFENAVLTRVKLTGGAGASKDVERADFGCTEVVIDGKTWWYCS